MTRRSACAVVALLAGCAQLPSVSYDSDGGETAPSHSDAAAPPLDAGDDASADADLPLPLDVDPPIDAGLHILCGSTTVPNCAFCSGLPLRCKAAGRDECVADCVACAANWEPCLHCPNGNAPRGNCLPVGPGGRVQCATTNLCACTTPAECLPVAGAAATCEPMASGGKCLTCGVPGTNGAACASADGGAGVCKITAGTTPSCQ